MIVARTPLKGTIRFVFYRSEVCVAFLNKACQLSWPLVTYSRNVWLDCVMGVQRNLRSPRLGGRVGC